MERATRLLEKLVAAKHAEQRATLHSILVTVAPEAGSVAPPREAFEPPPEPPEASALVTFWERVTTLDALDGGRHLNHSRKAG